MGLAEQRLMLIYLLFFLSTIEAQQRTYRGFANVPYAIDPTSTGKGYEKRHFGLVKLVATTYRCATMTPCSGTAFQRIVRYLRGQNSDGAKLNMTVPVVIYANLASPSKRESYEMSLHISQQYQENPPQPTDNNVYLKMIPPATVYSKKFTGFLNESFAKQQYEELRDMLLAENAKFYGNAFMTAQYDFNTQMTNHRNEVWIVGKVN